MIMNQATELPSEPLLMIFADGPFPGAHIAPPCLKWPLPDRIAAFEHYYDGCYVKVFQSRGYAGPGEARGAKYEWVELPYWIEMDIELNLGRWI